MFQIVLLCFTCTILATPDINAAQKVIADHQCAEQCLRDCKRLSDYVQDVIGNINAIVIQRDQPTFQLDNPKIAHDYNQTIKRLKTIIDGFNSEEYCKVTGTEFVKPSVTGNWDKKSGCDNIPRLFASLDELHEFFKRCNANLRGKMDSVSAGLERNKAAVDEARMVLGVKPLTEEEVAERKQDAAKGKTARRNAARRARAKEVKAQDVAQQESELQAAAASAVRASEKFARQGAAREAAAQEFRDWLVERYKEMYPDLDTGMLQKMVMRMYEDSNKMEGIDNLELITNRLTESVTGLQMAIRAEMMRYSKCQVPHDTFVKICAEIVVSKLFRDELHSCEDLQSCKDLFEHKVLPAVAQVSIGVDSLGVVCAGGKRSRAVIQEQTAQRRDCEVYETNVFRYFAKRMSEKSGLRRNDCQKSGLRRNDCQKIVRCYFEKINNQVISVAGQSDTKVVDIIDHVHTNAMLRTRKDNPTMSEMLESQEVDNVLREFKICFDARLLPDFYYGLKGCKSYKEFERFADKICNDARTLARYLGQPVKSL